MSTNKNVSPKAAERARQRQERQGQRRQRQRIRRWGVLILASTVVLALIVSLFLPSFPIGQRSQGNSIGTETSITPFQPHLPVGETYDNYNTNPPASGYHDPRPATYGVSTEPLPKERVVHNLEHGAVAIWYNTADAAVVDQIEEFGQSLPNYPTCLVVTPYPDMDSLIALTAWGRILVLDQFDAEQMRAFFIQYASYLGPEAGVCLRESTSGEVMN